MNMRAMTAADLELLSEIDATVQSTKYLHVEQSGEGLSVGWRVEERALREGRAASNAVNEDLAFSYKQVASGIEDGVAAVTDRDGLLLAALLAIPRPERKVMQLLDLRVDFDIRREGLGTGLWYMALQVARQAEMRAVMAETTSENVLAASFLVKQGFKLAGVDTMRHSNHDLVKERATLVWYLAFD
jgi:N-acetylglutamate synthase-like GNAT family acetyltransferase